MASLFHRWISRCSPRLTVARATLSSLSVITMEAGPLQEAVSQLIGSPSDLVVEKVKLGLFTESKAVHEYRPISPVSDWSKSDRALWAFVNSVVNGHLDNLAGYFAGKPESLAILRVLHVLMLVNNNMSEGGDGKQKHSGSKRRGH